VAEIRVVKINLSPFLQKEPNWLDMDPCFIELGQTAEERYRRYVTFMKEAIPVEELRLTREAVQRGQLTGNQRFVDEIERVAGVRIERRGQGRPRLEICPLF
ncbi:hypothetical protein NS832_32960, partial [Pseudomonas aeruginosa]|nr:hypothetical protein [Pseudomonas aeruginosa]